MAICNKPPLELYQRKVKLQTQFGLSSTRKTGALLRSKGRWYEYGNKASWRLALQLKHQAASRHIPQINTQSLGFTTSPLEINAAFKSFYSNLYTSEPPPTDLNMNNFFDSIEIPTIDRATRLSLNQPITVEEILSSIREMNNSKTPGPDGLPSEFYKKNLYSTSPVITRYV